MTCHLCGSPCDAPLLLGDMLQRRGIRCHHYCMLFSKDLPQKGKDDEGLQGFRLSDIRQQAKLCLRRKCHYCHRGGAHAACSHDNCTKKFHIPCAVYAGALLSFFGSFDVHCSEHRPRQSLDPARLRDESCGICLSTTGRPDGLNVLCTPCCGHNFHRLCLQQMALSSGYFFTCPICRDKNNRTGFLRHMKKFGVFVPQRDASWETEPHAFSDLLEHHSGCDQRFCLSTRGRQHMIKDHSDWGQLLCYSCAAFGSHRVCAGRPARLPWFCPDCELVFCSRRAPARVLRRPTLRQLLMSEDRPATADTMMAVLAPDGGEPSWQRAMTMVDDPRQLLRFTWHRVTRTVTIRTRAVPDPRQPGHVLLPVRLRCEEGQLAPRVLLSRTDRGQAEQAARYGGSATVQLSSTKRKEAAGRAGTDKSSRLSFTILPPTNPPQLQTDPVSGPANSQPDAVSDPPIQHSVSESPTELVNCVSGVPKKRGGRPKKRLQGAALLAWQRRHQRGEPPRAETQQPDPVPSPPKQHSHGFSESQPQLVDCVSGVTKKRGGRPRKRRRVSRELVLQLARFQQHDETKQPDEVASLPKQPDSAPSLPEEQLDAVSSLPKQQPGAVPSLPKQQPDAVPSLPKQQPDAVPSLPKQQPGAVPSLPKQQPDAVPTLPKQQPDSAPSLPKQQPDALPSLPKQRSDAVRSLPKQQPDSAPSLPKQPSSVASLPKQQPDAIPSLPKQQPDAVPSLPKQQPDAVPSLPKQQPDAVPSLPKQQPDAVPSLPKQQPDAVPSLPKQQLDAVPSLPKQQPDAIPSLPEQQPDAVPSLPKQQPDAVPSLPKQQLDSVTSLPKQLPESAPSPIKWHPDAVSESPTALTNCVSGVTKKRRGRSRKRRRSSGGFVPQYAGFQQHEIRQPATVRSPPKHQPDSVSGSPIELVNGVSGVPKKRGGRRKKRLQGAALLAWQRRHQRGEPPRAETQQRYSVPSPPKQHPGVVSESPSQLVNCVTGVTKKRGGRPRNRRRVSRQFVLQLARCQHHDVTRQPGAVPSPPNTHPNTFWSPTKQQPDWTSSPPKQHSHFVTESPPQLVNCLTGVTKKRGGRPRKRRRSSGRLVPQFAGFQQHKIKQPDAVRSPPKQQPDASPRPSKYQPNAVFIPPKQQPYLAPSPLRQQPDSSPGLPKQQPYSAPSPPKQQPYTAPTPSSLRQQPYSVPGLPKQRLDVSESPAALVNGVSGVTKKRGGRRKKRLQGAALLAWQRRHQPGQPPRAAPASSTAAHTPGEWHMPAVCSTM